MTSNRLFIIGLSGTTNSGKSTISSMLQKALPATTKCICQDSYYYEPNSPLVPKDNNGYQNWERLDALDMEKMMRDIHSYIEERRDDPRPHLLIIEGIMIFNHRLLSQLFDKKYFIKISQGTCAERRSERIYNPPDPPGYFEAFVWPMYLKNLNDIQGQMDIEYLDGSDDLQTIFEKIFHDTLSLFTSSSRNNQPL